MLFIGLSRLFLGVHFLTDVLAGHILGLAWLIGATSVFEIWRVERGRPPVHVLDEGIEPEEVEALIHDPDEDDTTDEPDSSKTLTG